MKKDSCIKVLVLCVVVIFSTVPLAPPSSHAQSKIGQVVALGQAQSRQFTVPVQRMIQSSGRKTPPDQPPKRDDDEVENELRIEPPVDPSVRPEDIRPTNPETVVKANPGNSPKSGAPLAPDTFTFYRNTPLASAPVVGGVTLSFYSPVEPSAAVNGRVFAYTTNNYLAISGDQGLTFTYFNPFDNFPADGVNDPIDGGFGGDQYLYYERTRGLLLWLIQYTAGNNSNRHRLCVARSQADALNNSWLIYDFTPATYGFNTPPAGASGFWFDFPDLAVSNNFLYLTTNVFTRVLPNPNNPCAGTCGGPPVPCPGPGTCPGGCTNTCSTVGAVIARIPLNALAQGVGFSGDVYTDTNFSYRCTQGARGTMYWAAHNSTSQIRIYRWPESTTSIDSDNVNHAAYNIPATCTSPNTPPGCGQMNAVSPDGRNFAGKEDSRILGAYVANGVIGFMWDAAEGGGFPFPQVQWLRFNESNRNLITQWQIFNNAHAFLYPSVHPNDRGHLGGTMAWGGGIFFPNALAWIADDFNQAAAVPFDNLSIAQGLAGPADNRWGDYFATRVNVPYGNTWVGSAFVQNTAPGTAKEPHFVWFGRERDKPPTTNTIYVNKGNTTGYEDGSSAHPYNTVAEGNFACSTGDTLIIHAGNYNETGSFKRAATVRNEGGLVKIGAP